MDVRGPMYLDRLSQSPCAPGSSAKAFSNMARFVISNPSSPASKSATIVLGCADLVTVKTQVMMGVGTMSSSASSAGETGLPSSSVIDGFGSSISDTWKVSFKLLSAYLLRSTHVSLPNCRTSTTSSLPGVSWTSQTPWERNDSRNSGVLGLALALSDSYECSAAKAETSTPSPARSV